MRNLVAPLAVLLMIAVAVGAAVWMDAKDREAREAAREDGHEAGLLDLPVEACPYGMDGWKGEPDRARAWRRGWLEGRKEALRRGKAPVPTDRRRPGGG